MFVRSKGRSNSSRCYPRSTQAQASASHAASPEDQGSEDILAAASKVAAAIRSGDASSALKTFSTEVRTGVKSTMNDSMQDRRRPPKSTQLSWREEIFETLDNPEHNRFAKMYGLAMMILILIATAAFVLESEAVVETGVLYDSGALVILQNIELVSVILFSIEYVIRLCTCPCKKCGPVAFILNPSNLVDLLACAPYWITRSLDNGGSGLGFLRVIRLIRVFRIFKASKYSFGLAMFSGALRASIDPLSILLFTISLAVIILSSLMYLIEGEVGQPNTTSYDPGLLEASGVSGEVQLYCFGTIPRAFWWAVVTMTTVGYGDCYPITLVGKIICMFTMLSGVLILALPITVVGSNFQKMVEIHQEDTVLYGRTDLDSDGQVDETELRAFLNEKRRDGLLRRDIDLTPRALLDLFDVDGNNSLSFSEFQDLKEFVIDPQATDLSANVRILLQRTEREETEVAELKERLERIEAMLLAALGPQAASAALAEASVDGSLAPSSAPSALDATAASSAVTVGAVALSVSPVSDEHDVSIAPADR